MTTLHSPCTFEQSYENFESYPCNLIHKTSYPGTWKGYKQRLDNAASKLCSKNEMTIEVPFRDFVISPSTGAQQRNSLPTSSSIATAKITGSSETKHLQRS